MTENELIHYGVKGMRWGVRRYQNKDGTLTAAGRKRQAKYDYKQAKKMARSTFQSDKKKADEEFERDTTEQRTARERVNSDYGRRKRATDRYYQNEIAKQQGKVDEAKDDMDFWDPGTSMFYDARNKYNEELSNLRDLERRYEATSATNKMIRDNEIIKINERYSESGSMAYEKRNAAYAEAGKRYVDALKEAKKEYKKNK